MNNKESEEIEDFKARVKTLHNVAIEINVALEDQNKKMQINESLFERCFKAANSAITKINSVSKRKFNVTLYLFFFTVFMMFLIYFILF